MTVCIAAICQLDNQPMIVGATDRMVAAGDIEFEPPQTKVFVFTQGTVALMAGNAPMQTEVCNRTLAVLRTRPAGLVQDVAELFASQFAEYRRQRAEREVLAPLGLSADSFILRQQTMNPGLVGRLTDALQDYRIGVQTIITGVDSNGAHIYIVRDPGIAECNDLVGFSAIGYGQNHAQSQFMFSRYAGSWPFARALNLTYSAKRRAESAPNVGLDTDLFVITSAGMFQFVKEEILDYIKSVYESAKEREGEIVEESHSEIEALFAPVPQEEERGLATLPEEEPLGPPNIESEGIENDAGEGEVEKEKTEPDEGNN